MVLSIQIGMVLMAASLAGLWFSANALSLKTATTKTSKPTTIK